MAQLTPNYGLSMPDATDDFSDFRESYNENIEIIDENMGGGGGGDSVTWTQLQQTGTKIAEIDINGTSQDVYAPQGGGGSGDVSDVEVNGASVVDPISKVAEITSYEEVTLSEYEAIPVAERESNGIAYFIKDLDNESVQGYPPLIYSDEEREIGVWRDGKSLYQKTWSGLSIGSDTNWHTTGIDVSFADCLVDGISIDAYGQRIAESYGVDNGILFSRSPWYGQVISTITLRYTKTTDTAGSGTWNGQGGIAHHYSTNETVIGTWVDNKPLYERSISIAGVSISTNQTVTIYTQANISMKCFSGYLTENNITYVIPEVGVRIRQSGDNIQISAQSGASWTISEGYVTIQYTKTTD